MTDPVDTDALRARADDDDALGYPEAAALQRAAADEVDRLRTELDEGLAITKQHAKDGARERRLLERDVHRLRAVIENAPHNDLCKAANGWHTDECDCWKADAL